jgi:hypothetical protein
MSDYKSTTEIAKEVRAALKKELPGWKFSVTTHNFSMGSSITLSLMEGQEEVLAGWAEGLQQGQRYAQLNQYTWLSSGSEADREVMCSNGYYLTPSGFEVMGKAVEILSRHHWDRSEIQTDYFCCNFYMHVQIGKWDKPYQLKGN